MRSHRSTRDRWIGVWLITIVLHIPAASVLAQSQPDAEYREYVDNALREYRLSNFNEAKALFARAHALSPSARTLRGLGMCAFELRSYVEAIDWFEQALSSPDRPLTPDMRDEILGLLRQARAFITRVRLSVQPTWAKIRVDTQPAERDAAGFIRVDPGVHELAIEAAHYEPAMRTLRAVGGEELTLDIVLSPPREDASKDRPPETIPTSPIAEATPMSGSNTAEGSRAIAGPWIVVAASGAVTITGGVFLALALTSKASVENPEGAQPRYDRAADDRVLPFSAIGITGLALGGAGVLTGIIWMSTQPKNETQALTINLSPTGIQVRGKL
jgi:hypothetical protein